MNGQNQNRKKKYSMRTMDRTRKMKKEFTRKNEENLKLHARKNNNLMKRKRIIYEFANIARQTLLWVYFFVRVCVCFLFFFILFLRNEQLKKINPMKMIKKKIKQVFLNLQFDPWKNSILGMNLFGCKFCDKSDGDDDVQCDRKNFDSLLWALVTVFQVIF